jgi:O-antigen ligase
MISKKGPLARFQPSIAFVLLTVLFATLWLAGGASRSDVLGQVIVRAVAWTVLVAFFLFGELKSRVARPVAWLVGGALVLTLVQLVPLPPALWQALPGRALLSNAATVSGQAQPWRPWSIVPSGTVNAASSLVVPFAVLLVLSGLRNAERRLLPGMVLVLIVLSSLMGMIQFSGITINNPLVNDTVGEVAGTFANRNHFAMFVALGCLLAPAWALPAAGAAEWRALAAIGLLLLFALTILASGSRTGILLGTLGIVIGLVMARAGIRRTLRRYPVWVSWASVAGILFAILGVVLLSIAAGRAVSINRIWMADGGQDMRVRGLPVVWAMIREYFPFGIGLGAFEPVFRINEPFSLLKPTYFNHAHNDWLEIMIDAGLPGDLLLLVAITWWVRASIQAWWFAPQQHKATPRIGSAMLLLIMVGSMFDYPVRTPMMMAVTTLAAIWLADHRRTYALPTPSEHL